MPIKKNWFLISVELITITRKGQSVRKTLLYFSKRNGNIKLVLFCLEQTVLHKEKKIDLCLAKCCPEY